jgi:hypothetical protein
LTSLDLGASIFETSLLEPTTLSLLKSPDDETVAAKAMVEADEDDDDDDA